MNKIFALTFVVLLAASGAGHAQDYLSRLSSTDTNIRRGASEDFYGSGNPSKEITHKIAGLLDAELSEVTKQDDRIDEVQAHLQALGGSGDNAYLPILQKAVSSPIRAIARYGRSAIEELNETSESGHPLLLPEKVILLTESQAGSCKYLKQYTCEAHGDIEECLDEQREQAVENAANALMVLNQNESGFGIFSKSSVVANFYSCPYED